MSPKESQFMDLSYTTNVKIRVKACFPLERGEKGGELKTGMFLMLDRGIMDHWIYSKEPFDECHAWIDLLLLANIEDKKMVYKGEVIICKRGDVNYSIAWLAKRWGWSRHKVTDFIKALEHDEMVDSKRTYHRTVITIVNYDLYNIPISAKGQQKDSKRTAKGQQKDSKRTQLNNEKNEKNEKNNNKVFFPNDELLDSAFKDFIEMRKKMKSPLSDRAITLNINSLNKLSGGDNELAIEIINQTIMKGWKGFYPLKEETPKKGKSVDWDKELQEVLKHERSRSTQTDTANDGFISELSPGQPSRGGGGMG